MQSDSHILQTMQQFPGIGHSPSSVLQPHTLPETAVGKQDKYSLTCTSIHTA